ncbi:hypothetical protein BVH03_22110 [Pseudomonas sp. PA15(2017)]|uniref:hypothetical protein n=1 Tax=Pseudomonas sp. PA15(2017) TaxID=1932111 RepID=UPI0009674822|nr:hypothetical protein [Pseudomonas sp. PA15(2017)]OLU22947.1 hypothetical protein BVH03_22110 [Pseudomonas sp. PA15(2017)]
MEVKHQWFEELPEQCPPSGAFDPDQFVCYRLCESSAPSDGDFYSHRKLFPSKRYPVSECQARSVSVFKDSADLEPVLKIPAQRHKAVVELTLNKEDGVMMKTGNKSHYSWWRSCGFKLPSAAEESA